MKQQSSNHESNNTKHSDINDNLIEINLKLSKNIDLTHKDFELLFLLSLLEEHNEK